MSRTCALTGKSYLKGHKVSHSNRKKIKRFKVNLQNVSMYSDALKTRVHLRVATNTIRTVDHNGGLDAFLLSTPCSQLTCEAVSIKKRIKKALAAQKAA